MNEIKEGNEVGKSKIEKNSDFWHSTADKLIY